MRKPRDIDAELRALADKARDLKTRRITQYGELVMATGADRLDTEALAGLLAAAAENTDAATMEDWRRRGAAFFQGRSKPSRKSAPATDGDDQR